MIFSFFYFLELRRSETVVPLKYVNRPIVCVCERLIKFIVTKAIDIDSIKKKIGRKSFIYLIPMRESISFVHLLRHISLHSRTTT